MKKSKKLIAVMAMLLSIVTACTTQNHTTTATGQNVPQTAPFSVNPNNLEFYTDSVVVEIEQWRVYMRYVVHLQEEIKLLRLELEKLEY